MLREKGSIKKTLVLSVVESKQWRKKGGNSSEKYGQHRDEKEGTDKIYDDSSNTKKLLIFPIETVLLHSADLVILQWGITAIASHIGTVAATFFSFFPNRQLKTGSPLGKDIHERMYKEQK